MIMASIEDAFPDACREVVSSLWTVNAGTLPECSHAGLVMSRYLRIAVKQDHHEDAKKDLYHAIQIAIENSKDVYTKAYNNYQKGLNGSKGKFRTKDGIRMVLGLGGENVLETGLTLHHTYGTPYIPGSALKGLASHYCDHVWGEGKKDTRFKRDGEYHRTLFGTSDDSGHIIFHDALIHPDSLTDSLCRDIMTPHHSHYYNGDGAPTDFDDPIPVSFLSVSGTFCIAVSCDIQDDLDGRGKKWEGLAFTILSEALEHWGIGGKTNAGYGRMQMLKENEQIPKAKPEYTSRLSIAGKTYTPSKMYRQGNNDNAFISGPKKTGSSSHGSSEHFGEKKPGSKQYPSKKNFQKNW